MATLIGNVTSLNGSVTAVSGSGEKRELAVGDPIHSDDVIHPSAESNIELTLLNGETVSLAGGEVWAGGQAGGEIVGDAVGTVSVVSGQVVAVAADGSERTVLAGDIIYADEVKGLQPDLELDL